MSVSQHVVGLGRDFEAAWEAYLEVEGEPWEWADDAQHLWVAQVGVLPLWLDLSGARGEEAPMG